MEPSAGTAGGGLSRRFGLPLSASNFIQAPLSALLEYSGILRPQSPESEGLVPATPAESDGEVTIRIFGAGDQDNGRGSVDSMGGSAEQVGGGSESTAGEASASPASADGGDAGAAGGNGRESSYQRYEIQQIARWIERVLPFSLLLLVVFIRQHLQGFFVTIWIAAVMFKSNDILRKQTALKGERRISVLVGITLIFVLHVVGVYWWYRNDDLLHPLILHPPTEIPPFWHAVFIIVVNDTMVRLAAMAFKCVLLIYCKNSRGHNYQK